MSYEKQNFQDGQVLTAEMLNKMEAWMSMAQPPYVEVFETEIVSETTGAVNAEGGLLLQCAYPITAGATYIINWNGIEYSCVAIDYGGMIMLGNYGAMLGGDDTGEPFLAMYMEENEGVICAIVSVDGSAEATVSITGEVEIIHQMEEKFIPKTEVPKIDLIDLGASTLTTDGKFIKVIFDEPLTEEFYKSAISTGRFNLRINVSCSTIEFGDMVNYTTTIGSEDGEFNLCIPVIRHWILPDGSFVLKATTFISHNVLIVDLNDSVISVALKSISALATA